MKKNIAIILIFNVIGLMAQTIEPVQVEYNGKLYWKYESVDENNNNPYKRYFKYDSSGQYLGWIYEFPRDGSWISFYKEDSSKVASIFQIKNNLLNGLSTQYYLNGQKQSEYEFCDRQENGYVRYWNKQGILISESFYKYSKCFNSSVKEGEWKDWDNKGNLIQVNQYRKDVLHGRQVEYYANGQLKKEEFYLEGERDSTKTEFHLNGQLSRQIKYKNGKFVEDNPNLEFHQNGKISGQGNLENGQKKGLWEYYYENGNKESEGEYGTYIHEHEHGNLYFYHKQGLWKYWYPNGKMKAIGNYDESNVESIDIDKEILKAKSIRNSGWKYFNKKGKEISIEEFRLNGIELNDY